MSSATVGLIKPPAVGGIGLAPAPVPPMAPAGVKKRKKKGGIVGKPDGGPRMGGKPMMDSGMKMSGKGGMKPMKPMMNKDPMAEMTGMPTKKEVK